MNHQITLEELELIPKQTFIDRSIYATPCGGCVCNHCANNVDCMEAVMGEDKFACFNCDECLIILAMAGIIGNQSVSNIRSLIKEQKI